MENNFVAQFSLFRNVDSSITINTKKYIQILVYSCCFIEAYRNGQGAAIFVNLESKGNMYIRNSCFSVCYTIIDDSGQACTMLFSPTEYNELIFDNNCIYMCSPNNSIQRRTTLHYSNVNSSISHLNSSMVSVYRNGGFVSIMPLNNVISYCSFHNHTISDSILFNCQYSYHYILQTNIIEIKQKTNPTYGVIFAHYNANVFANDCCFIINPPNGYKFQTDIGQITIYGCHLPEVFSSTGSVTIQSPNEQLQQYSYHYITLSYCLSLIHFHHDSYFIYVNQTLLPHHSNSKFEILIFFAMIQSLIQCL